MEKNTESYIFLIKDDEVLLQEILVFGVGHLDLGPLGSLKQCHHKEYQEDDRRPAQDDLKDLVPVEIVVRTVLLSRPRPPHRALEAASFVVRKPAVAVVVFLLLVHRAARSPLLRP